MRKSLFCCTIELSLFVCCCNCRRCRRENVTSCLTLVLFLSGTHSHTLALLLSKFCGGFSHWFFRAFLSSFTWWAINFLSCFLFFVTSWNSVRGRRLLLFCEAFWDLFCPVNYYTQPKKCTVRTWRVYRHHDQYKCCMIHSHSWADTKKNASQEKE